jgi:DNA-binding transcriptional MerR regulator
MTGSNSGQGTFDDAGEGDGYGGPQVCDVVGITYRQLDYWDRTDLLKPSLSSAHGSGTQRRYSYRDLVQLKIIKSLLDAGVKLQTARKAIDSLRTERGVDWQTASLVLNGKGSVLARNGEHLIDLVRDGQGVFNVVALGGMVDELDARILQLAPAAPTNTVAPDVRQAAEGG